MKVIYEWSVEEVDDNEDIIDANHYDNLSDITNLSENERLVLVRRELNSDDFTEDTHWAYIENGILPNFFSDSMGVVLEGMKVPQKKMQEFNKHYKYVSSAKIELPHLVPVNYLNTVEQNKKIEYGSYLVVRKDGKKHLETFNGTGWAYNNSSIIAFYLPKIN